MNEVERCRIAILFGHTRAVAATVALACLCCCTKSSLHGAHADDASGVGGARGDGPPAFLDAVLASSSGGATFGTGGVATGGARGQLDGGPSSGGVAGASSTQKSGGAGGRTSTGGNSGALDAAVAVDGVATIEVRAPVDAVLMPDGACDEAQLWAAVLRGAGGDYCTEYFDLPDGGLGSAMISATGYLVFDGDGRVVDNTFFSGSATQMWLDGLGTMRWPCRAGETVRYMCIQWPI